jgi:CubicO group peptidase (beta-lactamase class C family)
MAHGFATLILTALVSATPLEATAQQPLWGDDLIAKVDSLAAATLARGQVAGLSIALYQRDDVLLVSGYGLADIENDVPATSETVYRIGSLTKQFTAAAVMQLVEAGRIDLDARITTYLPDFDTQGRAVTVRHLLTHTSGIASYTGLAKWRPMIRRDLSDDELVALFEDEPFDFEPGEQYRYSNSGYYLLGMIIAATSGMSYRDYLQRHVLGPQGLTNTHYCDERPIISGRAEGYLVVDGALVNDDPLSMNQPGAAGALCSTAFDLLAWSRDLREGDVVSPESYQAMITPGALNDGNRTSYGFGLGVGELDGHRRIAHSGGINGFRSAMAYYPDDDLAVIVLVNTEGPTAGQMAGIIAKWALGIEVLVVRDEKLSDSEMAVYEGTYRLGPDFDLAIFARSGRLFSRATGQSRVRLRAQGNHTFIPTFADDVRLVFRVDGGRATAVVLHQGGGTREGVRVE